MPSFSAPTRRAALQGLGALAFTTTTGARWLTPAEAATARIPLTVPTPAQSRTLEALGETLRPGATRAGIVHFVDHQLGQPPADSLLMLRYLDVPPPYAAFYQPALAALATHAHAQPRLRLRRARPRAAVRAAVRAGPNLRLRPAARWQGPPSPLLYLAVRADAVDVVLRHARRPRAPLPPHDGASCPRLAGRAVPDA